MPHEDQVTSEKIIPSQFLSSERLAQYAEASGDHNPIHLSDEVARNAGLPGVIVHGMLTASLMSGFACEKRLQSRSEVRVSSLQIRFRAMVQRGESLILHAIPKGNDSLEVLAKNSSGDTVVSALVTFC